MKNIRKDAKKMELSFYDKLNIIMPGKIPYETFKSYSIDRIKLLRKIESGTDNIFTIDSLYKDLISHFALRLIVIQSHVTLQWFVTMETKLFKYRINQMNTYEFNNFYNTKFISKFNNLTESTITNNIKKEKQVQKISKYGQYDPDFDIPPINYEFIHFSKCSHTMSKRKIKLVQGYLPSTPETQKDFVITEFNNFIEREMHKLSNNSIRDERLIRLHSDLFISCKNSSDKGTPNISIKNIYQENFPLCMKLLIGKLEREKHLKHNDRNQLSLFLKDLGVPIEDTISYMQSHLYQMKNKELVYNIRHNYGLEGKKANYSCFSCQKIFSLSSEPNSTGCPFINNISLAEQFINIESADPLTNCKKYFVTQLQDKNISSNNLLIRSPAEFYKALCKFKKNK